MSTPSETWAPDTVAGVQDAVREAAAIRMPLRLVGRGTWLDAGRPPAADGRPLRLDALCGITRYTPGDLTLTARGATTLDDIAAATRVEGQWLALDPFSAATHGGTIGATFATASAGPLAHSLGQPRDLALGMEVVTGDGAIVRTGGRVVKNVAGFDLTRLMTGAWGTLGVITEITVRLRARPEIDQTLALAVSDPLERSGDIGPTIRDAAMAPLAAELLNPALARRLELPSSDRAILVVRLGGNGDRVAAERATLSRLGDTTSLGPDVWSTLRRCESTSPDDAAVIRWSGLPARIGETWRHVVETCRRFPDALIHATLGRGVVRAIIPHPDPAALAGALRANRGSGPEVSTVRIAERLPPSLWVTEANPAVLDRLSRGIRRAFDPRHVLNTGILGEGLTDG